MNPEILEIDEETRRTVLELFGLETDSEGFILRDGEKVTCPHEEEPVKAEDFAVLPDNEKNFKIIKPTPYSFSMEVAENWSDYK